MALKLVRTLSDPNDERLDGIVGSWTYKATGKRIKRRIKKHIKDESLYLVLEDNHLIGAVALKLRIKDKKAEITGFAVARKMRNRGYGRMIMDLVASEFSDYLSLEVETDDTAVQFYRKCGFSIGKIWTMDKGITRYQLRKDNADKE